MVGFKFLKKSLIFLYFHSMLHLMQFKKKECLYYNFWGKVFVKLPFSKNSCPIWFGLVSIRWVMWKKDYLWCNGCEKYEIVYYYYASIVQQRKEKPAF